MDVSLDADQQLLVDTVARLAGELRAPAPVELPTDEDDPAAWEQLCGMGLVGLHLAEAIGGGGASSADVGLVTTELARPLLLVPFLGPAVLAPELLARAGATPERDATLAALLAGERRVTVALDPTLRDVGRVGEPAMAFDARGAAHALVLDDADRPVAVPLADPGRAEGRAGHDDPGRADGRDERVDPVDLTRRIVAVPAGRGTELEPCAGPLDAEGLARFAAFAQAMVAADLVGVMHGALDAAVAYVAERQQFGVPVGSFQAVQHLAADAAVALEAARSTAWHAAWAADQLPIAEARLAAHHAKAFVGRVALEVVEIHTQLLGGIAITWEERAHLRVRRVLLDRLVFGDVAHHEDALADLLLATNDRPSDDGPNDGPAAGAPGAAR